MFDDPIAPLQSPCMGCQQRHAACWSSCDKYWAYRGTIDKINAEKAAQRPLDEAFALRGDKISQLVILPVLHPDLELVDALDETERGDKGFGSTGR